MTIVSIKSNGAEGVVVEIEKLIKGRSDREIAEGAYVNLGCQPNITFSKGIVIGKEVFYK